MILLQQIGKNVLPDRYILMGNAGTFLTNQQAPHRDDVDGNRFFLPPTRCLLGQFRDIKERVSCSN